MSEPARSLDDWLSYAESVHSVGIDMGLERIATVAGRLGFQAPAHRCAPRSIIVAGTNGKGSTCLALEALLRGSGLRVGTTLSPHVHRFNERVRIDGAEADDDLLCRAFSAVETVRGDVPLTYFEYSALVALWTFREAAVDVAVLEVGLGGRLDAFNLVSADVAVITSIGLDHQAFLGREKAGVLRPGQRVVLGRDVTASVVAAAAGLDCRVTRLGEDFHVVARRHDWDFVGAHRHAGIPRSGLAPDNCALALEAAAHLAAPSPAAIAALGELTLPGRLERWQVAGSAGATPLVLDVAHNPAGARFLGRQLADRDPERRFVAVVGMLQDKDAAGVAAALAPWVGYWVCVPTFGPRGLSGTALAERLGVGAAAVAVADPAEGLRRALSLAEAGDGILAFGSFSLVERFREVLHDGLAGARPSAWPGVAATDEPAADATMDLPT